MEDTFVNCASACMSPAGALVVFVLFIGTLIYFDYDSRTRTPPSRQNTLSLRSP